MRSRHTVSFNSERDIADASVDGGFFNGLLGRYLEQNRMSAAEWLPKYLEE